MSPTVRTKSKDKKSGKETSKSSSKPSSNSNITNGIPPSGYNPLSGTFQTFERAHLPSANPVSGTSRFQNIDDTEYHNLNTSVTGVEYDAVSTNGSWSGESEDHKEKTSVSLPRPESVPGADNDKREKIRQKNEKKHQRQKERRAQELHERCSGYLMSRKLEALAQQLVSMGFSQERAMMALILNEGRVEESVSWLFEGSEEAKHVAQNLDGGSNLKIVILEELSRITDMEIRYKASKQEVERAVVSCEGDLEKAEEMLKLQKLEPPVAPPKPEGIGDHLTITNGKQPITINQNPIRIQGNSTSSTFVQHKRDEKDFNYTKVPGTVGSSIDPGNKPIQVLKKIQPKSDWAKPQQFATATEKRWAGGASNPSSSFSLASSLQPSPPTAKAEAHHMSIGNGLKNLQLGSMKEPVFVMQRPQTINAKQAASTSLGSSPPGTAMGWYPNSHETVNSHMLLPHGSVSRGLDHNALKPIPPYNNQLHYQPPQQFMPASSSMDSLGTARGQQQGLWRKGASPALAPASSLGLFSGLGTNSGSSVDWSTGNSMLQLDYTNVDWSLDRGSLSSRPDGLWTDTNQAMPRNAHMHDSFGYGLVANSSNAGQVQSNGNGAAIPVLQDGVASLNPTAGGSEWSSPFEETDIFSVPRQGEGRSGGANER